METSFERAIRTIGGNIELIGICCDRPELK